MPGKAPSASATKIAAVRDQLSAAGCQVFEPGSEGYAQATRIWNGAVEHRPGLVVHCLTVDDIQLSLAAAQAQGIQVSVRGGGHDWVGRALRPGGLVIDLSGMRRVAVDVDAHEARIDGGVTGSDVAAATADCGLVALTANIGAVGMAGLLLGGGYGPLTTRFGLTTDSLIAADVVLADGRLVTTDASHEPDLFWALRGGGGNFGVVASMRIRLYEVEELLAGVIMFPWSDAQSVMRGYGDLMSSLPDELAINLAMSVGPAGEPVIALAPVWSGERQEGEALIANLQNLGKPILTKIGPTPLGEMLSQNDARFVSGRHYATHTCWLRDLTPQAVSTLIAGFEARTSPLTTIVTHHFRGPGTDVPTDATAFGMRVEHFTVLVYCAWEPSPSIDPAVHRRWAADLPVRLAPWALPGAYANLLAPGAHAQIGAAYGANAPRLNKLKRKYDPNNVFSSAIPLPPD
ncbi:MAG: FAD-binding oxidoreductase [Dongiaceae bacterium]